MKHLDEGTVLVVRDLGSMDDATQAHLNDCDACAEALREARERSVEILDALSTLDDPVEPVPAKVAVRRRLDGARSARGAPAWRRWPLGRAAAVLLVTAGAASALPWSPVRSWWTDTRPEDGPDPIGTTELPQNPATGGIAVDTRDGRIAIAVRGAAPGARIEVLWVDGSTARVTAPAGTRFSVSEGLAEVDVVPGEIVVELPRSASDAVLEVGGVVYVRRTPTGVATPGPVLIQTAERITLRVPGG